MNWKKLGFRALSALDRELLTCLFRARVQNSDMIV